MLSYNSGEKNDLEAYVYRSIGGGNFEKVSYSLYYQMQMIERWCLCSRRWVIGAQKYWGWTLFHGFLIGSGVWKLKQILELATTI